MDFLIRKEAVEREAKERLIGEPAVESRNVHVPAAHKPGIGFGKRTINVTSFRFARAAVRKKPLLEVAP